MEFTINFLTIFFFEYFAIFSQTNGCKIFKNLKMKVSNYHSFNGDYNEFIRTISLNKGLYVIEFTEKWDPTCERFSRRLKNVASLNTEVTFLSVDIDENQEIKSHYAISSVPHLKFIVSDGKNSFSEVDQALGKNSNLVQQKIETIKREYCSSH